MNINTSAYFVSCPKHMEELLEKEIQSFGILETRQSYGGVMVRSDFLTMAKFILSTRLASRVFLKLTKESIRSEKEISAKFKNYDFTKEMDVDQTFKINTLFDGESAKKFKNSMIFSQFLKDAIADQFKEKLGKRPDVNKFTPEYSFLLRISKTPQTKGTFDATLYLDLTGTPLSNRGYRVGKHPSPLRENLAAAIVDQLPEVSDDQDFIDSMCGSGTLLIEYLIKKLELPAAYLKIMDIVDKEMVRFDFLQQNWFLNHSGYKEDFSKVLFEYYEKIKKIISSRPNFNVLGNEIHRRFYEDCGKNLKAAKLSSFATIVNKDVFDLTPKFDSGVIIANPPYGKRLQEVDDLKELYHDYGEHLKNHFKGYNAYIFTGNLELRKSISLQTSKRVPLMNGPIECRLFEYKLY